MATGDSSKALEALLHAERGSALAFSAEKLEAALAALRAADEALARAEAAARFADDDQAARPGLVAARDAARKEAAQRLWNLVVQRESLGVYDHEPLFRLYGVPPDLRLFFGPGRRG